MRTDQTQRIFQAVSEGAVTVLQGRHAISDQQGDVLTTVLGSCVAACLFDRSIGIGGMNHFLLPYGGPQNTDIRYAAAAMELLVNGLMRRGAERWRLEAMLFGGARITASLPDIGKLNAEAAQNFLDDEGIHLVTRDLGGTLARRIHFWPKTGRVAVRCLAPTITVPLESPTQPMVGEVTLFFDNCKLL